MLYAWLSCKRWSFFFLVFFFFFTHLYRRGTHSVTEMSAELLETLAFSSSNPCTREDGMNSCAPSCYTSSNAVSRRGNDDIGNTLMRHWFPGEKQKCMFIFCKQSFCLSFRLYVTSRGSHYRSPEVVNLRVAKTCTCRFWHYPYASKRFGLRRLKPQRAGWGCNCLVFLNDLDKKCFSMTADGDNFYNRKPFSARI